MAETRISPRYTRQLDVKVGDLEIHTTNVSIGGVQLCCPRMRYPGLRRAEKDGALKLAIRPSGTRDWLSMIGKVSYTNPAEDEYLIGIQFTDIGEDTGKRWLEYISTLASPASGK